MATLTTNPTFEIKIKQQKNNTDYCNTDFEQIMLKCGIKQYFYTSSEQAKREKRVFLSLFFSPLPPVHCKNAFGTVHVHPIAPQIKFCLPSSFQDFI